MSFPPGVVMAKRQLTGSRMLITGASQGIGRALAQAAVRRGVCVLAVARSEDLLQQLAAEARACGGVLEIVPADITRPEDRQRMYEAAYRCFGGLDILVNNAGVGATGHLIDAQPERLRRILEVNFFALAETTRLFLPLLRQGRQPAIVNVSSIAGKRGMPARSEYSASKFAVQGFSEALRAELAKEGIDVLVVNPGLTQTNFSRNLLERKARMPVDHLRGMTAERVAEAILRALERRRREITLTWSGKLIVLVSRFFPRLADRIAAAKVRALYREEIAAGPSAAAPPLPQVPAAPAANSSKLPAPPPAPPASPPAPSLTGTEALPAGQSSATASEPLAPSGAEQPASVGIVHLPQHLQR
jgi:short-subunit dehydrogenase